MSAAPAMIYFHGGGFYGGTTDCVENPCKALAEHAGAVVVNVDYRSAPEHPYPAGLHDCFAAVKWAYEHAAELNIDTAKIGVSGDSAGGNLAAVCALMDRDQGTHMIRFQALIYPAVTMTGQDTDDFHWDLREYACHSDPLLEAMASAPRITGENGDVLPGIYLQSADPADPYVSPLHAQLRGLADALIVTAEFDGLRLECEAYARALRRAGVRAKLIRYNGVEHAFIDKLGLYPQAEDCMAEIAKFLWESCGR